MGTSTFSMAREVAAFVSNAIAGVAIARSTGILGSGLAKPFRPRQPQSLRRSKLLRQRP